MSDLTERNADLGEAALRASCPDFGKNGTDKVAIRTHLIDTIANLLLVAERYELEGPGAILAGAKYAAVEEQLDAGSPDPRPAGMLFSGQLPDDDPRRQVTEL